MTSLLQREHNDWQRLGGLHTAEEIAHQPALWRALATALDEQRGRIDAFLGDWLRQPGHRVILTGAGSSAYIGEMAADTLNAAWAADVRAVASTRSWCGASSAANQAQPRSSSASSVWETMFETSDMERTV